MSALEHCALCRRSRKKQADMTERNEYRHKAQVYEEQAKPVSDPWVKERLCVLANYWREMADGKSGGRAEGLVEGPS
jgi:hypothetical protein